MFAIVFHIIRDEISLARFNPRLLISSVLYLPPRMSSEPPIQSPSSNHQLNVESFARELLTRNLIMKWKS